MAFFAEKVRRKVPGNFTFLLMTDRHDLDDQIYRRSPAAASPARPRRGPQQETTSIAS
jgi:type I site-specific restriction-modification system R (restriction) subunit